METDNSSIGFVLTDEIFQNNPALRGLVAQTVALYQAAGETLAQVKAAREHLDAIRIDSPELDAMVDIQREELTRESAVVSIIRSQSETALTALVVILGCYEYALHPL